LFVLADVFAGHL
jgi:hypothetical protein